MPKYRKFDEDFKAGVVRIVQETRKPIAQVARDLGVNEGTLGNWVSKARREREGGKTALSEDERAELARLRRENTELRMQFLPSQSSQARKSGPNLKTTEGAIRNAQLQHISLVVPRV